MHTCYTEKACFLLFSSLCHTYDSVKSLLARFKKIPLQIMLDGRHVYTVTIWNQSFAAVTLERKWYGQFLGKRTSGNFARKKKLKWHGNFRLTNFQKCCVDRATEAQIWVEFWSRRKNQTKQMTNIKNILSKYPRCPQQSKMFIKMSHLIPPKTVHICEAISSDSKYYFNFVVDEIYELGNNIKSRHDFCSLTANADVSLSWKCVLLQSQLSSNHLRVLDICSEMPSDFKKKIKIKIKIKIIFI